MKKLAIILATLLLALSFTSCGTVADIGREIAQQEYTVSDEMNITLTGFFTQQDALFVGYTALFLSMDSMVLVIERDVDDTTPYDYACKMAMGVGLSPADVEIFREDCARYSYVTNLLGKEFAGVCYVYYHEGTIWMVDMVCEPDQFEALENEFRYWAGSVYFN